MDYSYKELLKLVSEIIEYEDYSLLEQCNLIECGLTSLQVMQIVNNLRKFKIKVSFSDLMLSPYIKDWWKLINLNLKKEDRKESEHLKRKNNISYFPLTDVQHSYWIGRNNNQILGGVSCHIYLEFKSQYIDKKRLQDAWKKVQMRHSMLRAVIVESGEQKIQNHLYREEIIVHDFRSMDDSEKLRKIQQIRDDNSHRILDISHGQVAELELSLLDKINSIIHFDIDLLVADLESLKIIFRDLEKLYNEEDLEPIPSKISFSNYILKQNNKTDIEESKIFWGKLMDKLPGAPELPYDSTFDKAIDHRFKRQNYILDSDKWCLLKSVCKDNKVTPAMVLLTLFVKVLDRYSTSSEFLVNIPVFNRPEKYKDVVADFTNIVLLPVENQENKSFLEEIKKIRNNFLEKMRFSNYSGVNVIRDIMKRDKENKIVAPVVFSCDYGQPLFSNKFEESFGKLNFISSQTPQVVIDFQVFEINNGLMLSWDVLDKIFYKGTIQSMFKSFISQLEWVLNNVSNWNEELPNLEEEKYKYRYENIKTIDVRKKYCLHEKFLENVESMPDNIAIIEAQTEKKICYKDLASLSRKMATYLKKNNIKKGDKVAICLTRGIEQIVSILAILMIGACYVPISVKQPQNRIKRILEKCGAKLLITNYLEYIEENVIRMINISLDEINDYEPINKIEDYDVNESAYIIFTSGTTGESKGVEVSHKSAWNTIQDVNYRCNVDKNDKLLSVSSIEFDLSVYDIFGMLSQGGLIILIDEQSTRDPSMWISYIQKYNISLWNSAPFLIDMLISTSEQEDTKLNSLRKVLLSGDWIGIDIPKRLKSIAKNADILAMGGATEASIWSNYFEVKNPLNEKWKSIPYGKPLNGQIYRVVDDKGRDCPEWVPGELWIGGNGVAKGYVGDIKLTNEKFKIYRGLRWYKTGDIGMFWGDGTIEFLGRKDTQVKIKGHRIELGEIESVLAKYPGVIKSIVCAIGEKNNMKLAVYIKYRKYDNNRSKQVEISKIKEFLKQFLPQYMIPNIYYFSSTVPLSQNGKVDRKRIAMILGKSKDFSDNYEPPKGNLECKIGSIWKNILSIDKVSRYDNFFEVGGDSLKAVTLVGEIKKIVNDPLCISMQILFESPTIKSLAEGIKKKNEESKEIEIQTI